MDENGESHSELLDVYEVTTPEPIRAIQISRKVLNTSHFCFHHDSNFYLNYAQLMYLIALNVTMMLLTSLQ